MKHISLILAATIPALMASAQAAEPAGLILGLGFETTGPKGHFLNWAYPPNLYGLKNPEPGQLNSPGTSPSVAGHGKALNLKSQLHQYVDASGTGSPPELNVNKWTLAAWVRPQTNATPDTRWEVAEKAGAYWLNIRSDTMQVRAGGIFGGCDATGDWVFIDSVAKLVLGQWAHVAATYDGAAIRIYINGNLNKTAPAAGTTCVNTQPLTIGVKYRQDLGEYAAWYTGQIDDVRLYGRALPLAQIRAAKAAVLLN